MKMNRIIKLNLNDLYLIWQDLESTLINNDKTISEAVWNELVDIKVKLENIIFTGEENES